MRGRFPMRLWPLVVLGAALALAYLLPVVTTLDPLAQSLRIRLTPPIWDEDGRHGFVLGTDQLGRDLLTRILFGLRTSLEIGVAAASASAVIGVVLGLAAGYFRGWMDTLVTRLADIQLAFPLLVLAIAILAIVGGSAGPLTIVLALFGWAVYARVVRAVALVQSELDFVDAARLAGAGHLRVMFRHLLPNLLGPIFVLWTFAVAQMVVLEGALSFLGLGVRPPAPSLGGIMSEGRQLLEVAWWLTVFPGATLAAVVLALNALGDDLRDWLDPRASRQR